MIYHIFAEISKIFRNIYIKKYSILLSKKINYLTKKMWSPQQCINRLSLNLQYVWLSIYILLLEIGLQEFQNMIIMYISTYCKNFIQIGSTKVNFQHFSVFLFGITHYRYKNKYYFYIYVVASRKNYYKV